MLAFKTFGIELYVDLMLAFKTFGIELYVDLMLRSRLLE